VRETVLAVQGIAEDGSTAELGTFTFRVKNLPPPRIRMGSVWEEKSVTNGQISVSNKFFASYTPEDPIDMNYVIDNYEINIKGINRPVRGNGSVITAEARSIMKQAAKGTEISVTLEVINPKSGRKGKRISTFIKQ